MTDDGSDERVADILDHLSELRRRIIYSLIALVAASVVAFGFHDVLLGVLTAPFREIALRNGFAGQLYVHSVTEGFLVRIRISLLGGVILALPVFLYHILRFVFPGLTRAERRATGGALIAGSVLAVIGFFYSYTQVLPISLQFLTSRGFIPEDVGVLLNYRVSMSFVLQMLLIATVLFQLPVVVVVLLKLEVIDRRAGLKAAPYVIVVLLVVSAILTPPDIVSQIGLTLPLVALYFLALLVARVLGFGRGDR